MPFRNTHADNAKPQLLVFEFLLNLDFTNNRIIPGCQGSCHRESVTRGFVMGLMIEFIKIFHLKDLEKAKILWVKAEIVI
jgi:hypothetical protein